MNTAASSSSFGNITDYIESLNLDEATRCALLHKLCGLREQGLNIMITGATGSGKSSTINALFRADKARVGEGASPETQQIARYDFDGMTIWDTPGLGDGDEADRRHTEAIESKLRETGPDGKPLIDAVLVILEAGSRDLGTSYKLINEIVMPLLDDHKRLVVAINQADMALKGRHWDYDANQPDATLRWTRWRPWCASASPPPPEWMWSRFSTAPGTGKTACRCRLTTLPNCWRPSSGGCRRARGCWWRKT